MATPAGGSGNPGIIGPDGQPVIPLEGVENAGRGIFGKIVSKVGDTVGQMAVSGFDAWLQHRENKQAFEREKKEADTAHQREVADLIAAGLNPNYSLSRGASSAAGSPADVSQVGQGAARAIALKQMNAQTALLGAQAYETTQRGHRTRQEIQLNAPGGVSFERAQVEKALADLNLAERRNLFAPAIQRMYQEIATMSSAEEAARARAALDRFSSVGAANAADVQKLIAEYPEWARLLLTPINSLLQRSPLAFPTGR